MIQQYQISMEDMAYFIIDSFKILLKFKRYAQIHWLQIRSPDRTALLIIWIRIHMRSEWAIKRCCEFVQSAQHPIYSNEARWVRTPKFHRHMIAAMGVCVRHEEELFLCISSQN